MAKKDDPVKAFSVLLRRLRIDHGMTQEGLGAELGVDRAYISQLERGLKNPSLVTLCRLAKVLNTQVAFAGHDLA